MKSNHLLVAIVAAALPFAIVSAEDTAKPEATDQKQEQNSDQMGMMGMKMDGDQGNQGDTDHSHHH